MSDTLSHPNDSEILKSKLDYISSVVKKSEKYLIAAKVLHEKYTALYPQLSKSDDNDVQALLSYVNIVLTQYYDPIDNCLLKTPVLSPDFSVTCKFDTILTDVIFANRDGKIYGYIFHPRIKYEFFQGYNIFLLNDKTTSKQPNKEKLEAAYSELYTGFCKFIGIFQKNTLLSYTMYLLYIYEHNSIKGLNKDFYYFIPNPQSIYRTDISMNHCFCMKPNIKYILYGKKAMIMYGYDMYTVKEFFHRFSIGSPKHASILSNYTDMICSYVKNHCKKYTCPEYSIYYAVYNAAPYPYHIKLSFVNGTVSTALLSNTIYKTPPISAADNTCIEPFRQNHILMPDLLQVTNGYYPQKLCQLLNSMCNTVDISIVDRISELLAACTVNMLKHRKATVVLCSEENMPAVTDFFRHIISGLMPKCNTIIDRHDNTVLTLQTFSSSLTIEKLKEYNYTGVKAYFVDNPSDSKEISKARRSKLKEAANKLLAPIVIFHPFKDISCFPPDKFNFIDLSQWNKDNYIPLPYQDSQWAMIYLSIYGLSLIFKKRKSEFMFTVTSTEEMSDVTSIQNDDSIIPKLAETFISQYFVDRKTADERKAERKKLISELKAANPDLTADETETMLTELLAKQPLYTTFVSDFTEYAQYYIESQFSPSQIELYNISGSKLLEYVKTQMGYETKKSNIKYT